MDYRSSEIKAGIFVLISLIVFVGFLFVILGFNRMSDHEQYRARFIYVGGIEKGSLVRYAGLHVGQVADLRLSGDDDPRVELLLDVQKGTPIRSDSKAYITTIGIMGAFYVEIAAGSSDSARLSGGDLISSQDVSSFAQMAGPMNDATEEAHELLRRINDLLNDQNRQNISSMIAALNQMTVENGKNMDAMLKNVTVLSGNLAEISQAVENLLAANDGTLTRSLAHMEGLLDKSQQMAEQMQQMLAHTDGMLLENRGHAVQVMDHLETVTRNLQEFSQSIKEQPWNLVRKNYPPERKLAP